MRVYFFSENVDISNTVLVLREFKVETNSPRTLYSTETDSAKFENRRSVLAYNAKGWIYTELLLELAV